MSGSVADCYGH